MTGPNTPPPSSFSVPTEKGGPRSRPKGMPRSVAPSTQDQVQRWLDIFVPMTGLPKPRANDIRAELEDHLRARVDDLMITGLSEPEAVQQAVNELGETADLAKQFRTALKPKRNTLMHAALIAIAGSVLTLGVLSSINAPPPQQATPQKAAAVIQSDALPTNDYAFAAGGTVDLRTATLNTLFDQVRENLDRPLVIHWDHLDDIGIQMDKPLGLDADPVPTPEALRLAIAHTRNPDFGGIAVVNGPEVVEITTDGFLDRRTKQIRSRDVTDLIRHYEIPKQQQVFPPLRVELVRTRETAEAAGTEILSTIIELTTSQDWTDYGGDLAHANVVGNSLIIDAPTRIHAAVERVIEMMEVEVAQYNARSAEAAAQKSAEKQAKIGSLVPSLDDLRETISALKADESRAEIRRKVAVEEAARAMSTVKTLRVNGEEHMRKMNPTNPYLQLSTEQLEEILSETTQKAASLAAELADIKLRLDDAQAFRKNLLNDLVQLGYVPALNEAKAEAQRHRDQLKRNAQESTRTQSQAP